MLSQKPQGLMLKHLILIHCHKLFFNLCQIRRCKHCEFVNDVFLFSKHETYLKSTNFFHKLLPAVI